MPLNDREAERIIGDARQELAEVLEKLKHLQRRRDALMSLISSVEHVQQTSREERLWPAIEGVVSVEEFHEPLKEGPEESTMETARYLLGHAGRELTPAEIVDLAAAMGREVRYTTLYKALRRAAERKRGVVYKNGPKFGLREWRKEDGDEGA